jgi:O-succinylbenzoic acid--CoA ligase
MWNAHFKLSTLNASSIYTSELHAMVQLLEKGEPLRVQSSGSTGSPKPFYLNIDEAIASADLTIEYFNLKEQQRALVTLPLNAVSGALMVVRAMRAGLELHAVTPQSNPFIEFKDKGDGYFDFVALTPYQLAHSIDYLPLIKTLLVGGARLSDALLNTIPSGTPTTIYESYGMTETLTHVALRRRYPHAESLFSALKGVYFSSGDEGNLIIYPSHLRQKTMVTNDAVQLYSKTEFEYLGRLDHVINSGGVKLFPESIEQKLSQIVQAPFFVTALPHPILGEQVGLILEGDEALRRSVLIELNEIEWGAYEKPKRVEVVASFDYTATNKIDRIKTLKHLDL